MDASRIDTNTQKISSKSGRWFGYKLERKRVWNLGLKRHTYSLTGKIEVILDDGVYVVCRDWNDALRAADDFDRLIKKGESK